MDLSNISLFEGLKARLDFLGARTSVIAENIANADTPDFTARDIEKPNFRALIDGANSSPLRVSDPRHLNHAGSSQATDFKVVSAPDGEASLTGNNVSVETQAMKLSQTRQEYALATSVYRKGLSMLRLAARGQ